MKCVGRDMETDESIPKLLATLRDHFGSVNCVRWAKHGRYVASGSDDQVILIHERKPGSGTTEFGSGEPPDIENWKVAMTLRGHTADVVMVYSLSCLNRLVYRFSFTSYAGHFDFFKLLLYSIMSHSLPSPIICLYLCNMDIIKIPLIFL